MRLFGEGKLEAGVDQALQVSSSFALLVRVDPACACLQLVKKARSWNDDAAKKLVLRFLDTLGPNNPIAVRGRRRLSSILHV